MNKKDCIIRVILLANRVAQMHNLKSIYLVNTSNKTKLTESIETWANLNYEIFNDVHISLLWQNDQDEISAYVSFSLLFGNPCIEYNRLQYDGVSVKIEFDDIDHEALTKMISDLYNCNEKGKLEDIYKKSSVHTNNYKVSKVSFAQGGQNLGAILTDEILNTWEDMYDEFIILENDKLLNSHRTN